MKKRVLLTIMILFSLKVNSIDTQCKLPDIKFFEMIDEAGTSKFSFKPYVDYVESTLSTGAQGTVEILGVQFNKQLALGALYSVYSDFLAKLAEKGSDTPHPFPGFIKDYDSEDDRLNKFADALNSAADAFDQSLSIDHRVQLEAKVKGNAAKVPYVKGIVDYLVTKTQKQTKWFGLREFDEVIDPKPINAEALNSCLNYIYLFALSFLIKNEQDSSKFLGCMFQLTPDILERLEGAGVNIGVQQIFNDIESESGMSEKVKPTPLSIEESRACLNMLSSTLNSIANLKFS